MEMNKCLSFGASQSTIGPESSVRVSRILGLRRPKLDLDSVGNQSSLVRWHLCGGTVFCIEAQLSGRRHLPGQSAQASTDPFLANRKLDRCWTQARFSGLIPIATRSTP